MPSCLATPCVPLDLATCCNINYDPLASIKRLFSVPRCCVLPEDMVSGLAMHGKLVALSRGATTTKGITTCILSKYRTHIK